MYIPCCFLFCCWDLADTGKEKSRRHRGPRIEAGSRTSGWEPPQVKSCAHAPGCGKPQTRTSGHPLFFTIRMPIRWVLALPRNPYAWPDALLRPQGLCLASVNPSPDRDLPGAEASRPPSVGQSRPELSAAGVRPPRWQSKFTTMAEPWFSRRCPVAPVFGLPGQW